MEVFGGGNLGEEKRCKMEKLTGICKERLLPRYWSEGEVALMNQLMAASSPSVCCPSEKGE